MHVSFSFFLLLLHEENGKKYCVTLSHDKIKLERRKNIESMDGSSNSNNLKVVVKLILSGDNEKQCRNNKPHIPYSTLDQRKTR